MRFSYSISDYWIGFPEGDLSISVDDKIKKLVEFYSNGVTPKSASENKLMQYATLFNQKTENYLKKTNRIMLGDTITAKLIRMTAKNLNQKEQLVLNKSVLLSCELGDLLK